MSPRLRRVDLITFGLLFTIVIASVFVALSPMTKTNPEVTALLAYDLAVLSPLLYFFLIRKRKISKLTVIPFITIGIILATILLPENQHGHLNIIRMISIPAIEIFLVVTVLRKTYLVSKSLKANADNQEDAYLLIKKSNTEALGNSKFVKFLISEMAVLYYALIAWKKKTPSENEFTNFKDNGAVPMLWGLIFIILIETLVLHIMMAKWNMIAAWVLTILSIYSALMIFGHLKALSRRPSTIHGDKLILKNGLLATLIIDLKDIEKVELCNGQISEPNKMVGSLCLSKESNDHNVALHFSKPQIIEKFYGITQKCNRLLFFIDDKNNFVEKIRGKIA